MLAVREFLLGSSFMNILIEDAATLKYFTNDGQWTKNAAEGKSFATTVVALEAAKKEAIHEFNIVSYIPQTKQFINLDSGTGTVTGSV